MNLRALAALCGSVNPDVMNAHLKEFARWEKLSGTPSELESFRYLKSVIDGFGYQTELIFHDALISLPGRALVSIGSEELACITHSFSLSSSMEGLSGPLVYGGAGKAGDLEKLDAAGKIVLLDGIANPGATVQASRAGAIGQIHISPHEHLHEMCVSPVQAAKPWTSCRERSLSASPVTMAKA